MGKLRTERRYDPQFRGPTLPFGSEIFNHPIYTRDESKLRQISSEVLEVCLSDVLWTESAAGQAWHTPEEWKTTLHQKSTSKDSKRKKSEFKCWRTIFLVLTVQKRQEGPHRHTSNPGRSCSNVVEDISACPPGEGAFLEVILWRHHVWTEKNTCAPREESFLIPQKHIYVTRQTETNIWTSNKSTLSTTIDMSTVNDHNLDPGLDSRYLQFWKHLHPTDICGQEKDWQRFAQRSGPDDIRPKVWSKMSNNSQLDARQ